MKYLIVKTVEDIDVENSMDEKNPVMRTDVSGVVLCNTTREVCQVLNQASKENFDWAVFEVVDGKAIQRSVVFKRDGKAFYDVTLQ